MPHQPLHAHDCDRSTFLGSDDGHDFYHCSQGALPTLIARWGSAGSAYTSGLETALAVEKRDGADSTHPLVKALRIARARNLCA